MNEDFNKELHRTVITDFISYLNNKTNDYVIKGGTSLMLCYGLNRFSEDIDLDGKGDKIKDVVADFCKKNNFTYRIAKDTETVNRFMLNYGSDGNPLKIEVSYRSKEILPEVTNIINGIRVYNVDVLGQQKALAYSGRDKIRDLYDLSFICNNYFDELSAGTKTMIAGAVSQKGIQQFDYLIKSQEDPLIDKDVLADSFLNMMDKLGLLTDEEDKEIMKDYQKDVEFTFNKGSETFTVGKGSKRPLEN